MSQCAGGSSLAEAEAAEQERDKLKQEEVSATKSSITEGICVAFVTSTMFLNGQNQTFDLTFENGLLFSP